MSSEKYYCVNCQHLTTLNLHGRCEVCDSAQVISEHVLRRVADGKDISEVSKQASLDVAGKVRPTIYSRLTLYCVRSGIFYTTVYAKDEEHAHQEAVDVNRTWQVDGDLLDELTTLFVVTPVKAKETLDNAPSLR